MARSLNAILVCVDYADYLSICLPVNRHHFDRMLVVTTPTDAATQAVAARHGCELFQTTSFYDDGADFNKWKALEQGLDQLGREGWLCVMDADVLWPHDLGNWAPQQGYLYTPYRRMMTDMTRPIPPEHSWASFPRHHVLSDFSGYTQIFHAADPCLGAAPWHQTHWKHAGGADTFFQMQWPAARKQRPPWECLHLGEAGQNWCGRATEYLGGALPEGAAARQAQLRSYMQQRRGPGRSAARFEHEWIEPSK